MNRKTAWQSVISTLLAILVFWALAGLLFGLNLLPDSSSPVAAFVMILFSRAGDTVTIVGLCVLLLLIPRSRHTIALPVCVTVIVSSSMYVLLKIIFSVQPLTFSQLFLVSHYAFPSGHAVNNAALYTMLTIQTHAHFKNARLRILLSIAFMLLIMAIGYCRIHLGFHSAVDVLGGWLIGFTLALLVFFVLHAVTAHHHKID